MQKKFQKKNKRVTFAAILGKNTQNFYQNRKKSKFLKISNIS